MTLIRVLGATVKLQIQHTDLVPQIVFKIVKTSEKSFLAHFYSKKSYLYSSRKGGGERRQEKMTMAKPGKCISRQNCVFFLSSFPTSAANLFRFYSKRTTERSTTWH